MWVVGGRRSRVEAAKPEVVTPLEKGVLEFQQAGTDMAPVVPTERFWSDRLPRVVREGPVVVESRYEVIPRQAGVPLGGGLSYTCGARWGGHKSVPQAPVRGALVGEGQQGAVRDLLPPHLQPVAAVQQGPGKLALPGQGVIVQRPPGFEMCHSEPGAPVLQTEAPDGGRVAQPGVYLGGLKYVGGVQHKAGGKGCPEERGHIATPLRVGLLGRPQPFLGRLVTRAFRARPAKHRGPRPGVWHQALEWDGGVPWRRGPRRARCCAPLGPFTRPLHANNVGLPWDLELRPMIHAGKSALRRCFGRTPRQVPVRGGVLLRGTLQGAVHDAEEPRSPCQGEGGGTALRRSEPSVHQGHCAVVPAEELLQPVVAELPQEVSQPEHVLEELVYGGPSQQVLAGNRAELRCCSFGHQPGTEDLCPLAAGGTPRSHL